MTSSAGSLLNTRRRPLVQGLRFAIFVERYMYMYTRKLSLKEMIIHVEVIPKGKYCESARIQTQNSCVTVDHSNHVAKENVFHAWTNYQPEQEFSCSQNQLSIIQRDKTNQTARLLGTALSLHSSPIYFLRAEHQQQLSIARYCSTEADSGATELPLPPVK